MNCISQTQDEHCSLNKNDKRLDIAKFTWMELADHNPVKTLFFNDKLDLMAEKKNGRIAKDLLSKSEHYDWLLATIPSKGFIDPLDAGHIVKMILQLQYEWDYPNSECNHEDALFSLATVDEYIWACGVIFYALVCGPPRNDFDKRYIEFYNSMEIGIQVTPSEYFGAPLRTKMWNRVDDNARRCILSLVHNHSTVFKSKGVHEPLLENYYFHMLPKVEQQERKQCSPPDGKKELGGNDLITVREHQRRRSKLHKNLKTPPAQKTSSTKWQSSTDVSSFKEIIKLHKEDMEEYKAYKAKQKVDGRQVDCTNQWNNFWLKATKKERKKRRRPLTVSETKARKWDKVKGELFKRLTDDESRKLVSPLYDHPIFEKGTPFGPNPYR